MGGGGQGRPFSGSLGVPPGLGRANPEPDSTDWALGPGRGRSRTQAAPARETSDRRQGDRASAGSDGNPALHRWTQGIRGANHTQEVPFGLIPQPRVTVFSFQEYGMLPSSLVFDVEVSLQAQTQKTTWCVVPFLGRSQNRQN